MFQFMNYENAIQCTLDDTPVLSGLSIKVKLDNGEESDLHLSTSFRGEATGSNGSYTEYDYLYTDKADMITVNLKLHSFEKQVAVYIHVQVANEQPYGRQRSLAAENGIMIIIEQLSDVLGLMANYRHKDWWTRPHFDINYRTLPPRTQSLLWKTNQGYYQLLPVCDNKYRADLVGCERGMMVTLSSFQGGHDECHTLAFLLGTGTDPFELAEENTQSALLLIDASITVRRQKRYPEILDYLGWCSWDAFYHEVDEKGLLDKARELQSLDLPVRWVMIDDGWSQVDNNGRKLKGFDAEQTKFPNGLSATISALKKEFGIRWVGVWHTIVGYWGGIDPISINGCEESIYRTNKGKYIPYPKATRAFGFWHAWHSRLKRDGVDFVKVDSQSAIYNYMKDELPIGEAAFEAHTALEASVALNFEGCIINCMGMASENIWHRPMSSVSRNSDDFVPQERDSFKEHALQNAYNSYYHAPFYWGDWDMFWTDNHDSEQNMILRAVSGGPIYFSDPLLRTNPNLLSPLIYRDGRIIRCDRPGLPTEDCLFIDPTMQQIPLKIWNTINGVGVIAVFHISKDGADVEGSICPVDIPGLMGDRFIVVDRMNETVIRLHRDERYPIRLGDRNSALYLIYAVKGPVVPIGLMNKLISADSMISVRTDVKQTYVRLKEGGAFAFTAIRRPKAVYISGKEIRIDPVKDEVGLYQVDCYDQHSNLEIRIEHG